MDLTTQELMDALKKAPTHTGWVYVNVGGDTQPYRRIREIEFDSEGDILIHLFGAARLDTTRILYKYNEGSTNV